MSIAKRREREKKQRWNDIVEAAEKLFFDRGYDDVSMKDIANEVELSKATLYLYFNNKEELFFAVVLRGTKILNSMIIKEVEKATTGIDKVSAFRKAYHEFTSNYPDYIRVYKYFQSGRFDIKKILDDGYMKDVISRSKQYSAVPTPFDDIHGMSEYLREIMELRTERFNIMCNSIQTGLDDETIRSDVDPVEAAVLLSSISKRMSDIPLDHEKLLESRGIDREKFVGDVEDLIRHMIMNKDME